MGEMFLNCFKVFAVSESGNSYNLSWTLMQVVNSRTTIKMVIFPLKDVSVKNINPLGNAQRSSSRSFKVIKVKISPKLIYELM